MVTDIDIEYHIDGLANRDVAIVLLTVPTADGGITTQGVSKRDPRDKPNEDIGVLLATARAYQAMGRRLERQVRGKIKHADDVEEMKKHQKPAPQGRGE